jgi:hypothetical protein
MWKIVDFNFIGRKNFHYHRIQPEEIFKFHNQLKIIT